MKVDWFSRLYRLGMWAHRRWTPRRALPRPVISIGGLSAGGSGKTPCAAWLAMALAGRGRKPVLLSRGHGRRGRGTEVVQPWALGAAARYGDEPVALARRTGLPVVVGASRWRAGLWALERLEAELFVLDDGFQHWGLVRDFDLVVLDACVDPAGMKLLPLGRWREDLDALGRASAVLLHRCNQAAAGRAALWKAGIAGVRGAEWAASRVFESDVVPRELGPLPGADFGVWSGRKVALASATASAESFERTARELGMVVVEHLKLADHARIGRRRLLQLMQRARAQGAEGVVVTEKDAVKLEVPPEAPVPVLELAVDLRPRREEALLLLVEACLSLDSRRV